MVPFAGISGMPGALYNLMRQLVRTQGHGNQHLRITDEGDVARHLRRTKGGRLERVKILRGHHVDRSRYTGAMLRAIRAERGCGRPPKVLAARRAREQGSAAA